jgi:hypothetical protein
MQLDLVCVARQNEQLAVSILGVFHRRVPVVGVEENAICFAAESGERLGEEDSMAERRGIGRVEAVCVVGPDNCRVAFFGRWAARGAARGVQHPAKDDEAGEEVEVSAVPAECRYSGVVHESWELI